jgi:DNA-binding NarL/FixJ family response regulator
VSNWRRRKTTTGRRELAFGIVEEDTVTELRNPKIVLADDEGSIRLMMKTVLAAAGCQVLAEARNGREAVEAYRAHHPDVLLLDLNMPVMTGEEALAAIVGEFPQAVVIMLTSVADSASVDRCLDAGALNFVRKDTPLPQIVETVLTTWREATAAGIAP